MTELLLIIESHWIWRVLFALIMVAIGLGFAGIVSSNPRPMGRVKFGLLFLYTLSILHGAASVWLYLTQFNMDMASAITLGIHLFGYVLIAFAARRRSVDAYGHTRNAYFIAIPIAHLFLLFKGAKAHPTMPRTIWQRAKALAPFMLLAPFALAPGLLLLFLTHEVNTTPFNIRSVSVERGAKILALVNQNLTPYAIDPITTLTGAASQGKQLVYSYTITNTDDQAAFDPANVELIVKPKVKASVCDHPNMSYIILGGGEIVFNYFIENTGHTFSISMTDCE